MNTPCKKLTTTRLTKTLVCMMLVIGVFRTPAFSCSPDGKDGIVPENNLYIGPEQESANMTEDLFNDVIQTVEDVYKPIIKNDRKANLNVIRSWTDGTVNAYAQQSGSTYTVKMFGGLARHNTITPDGFALVVCHEIGHHIGGAPKKTSWFSSSWASNEGQSDYWGTMKCFRRVFENDNNVDVIAKMEIPEFVTEQCAKSFTTENEKALCARTAMAGKSLAELFRALRKQTEPVKFDTPDPKVATSTNHSHPQPQCRMDTYFQGALCPADIDSTVSRSDADQGVCSRTNNDPLGVRPLCWYKP